MSRLPTSSLDRVVGAMGARLLERRWRARLLSVAAGLLVLASASPAHAIRPFLTDDAHVVGVGRVQLETYWRRDRASLQHWLLPAFGPTRWMEITLGGVHGLGGLGPTTEQPRHAFGGPILQSKLLFRESVPNEPPGFALVLGGVSPAGRGGFEAPGWSGFSYLAVTQSFIKEDDFLIHANVGVSTASAPGLSPGRLTWGIGTQVETIWDFHLIGEVFSGDPYVRSAGAAYQAGFRILFDEHLQLDGTWGGGLWGDDPMPVWFSSGIRVVSGALW